MLHFRIISTHILMKRMTIVVSYTSCKIHISTHILIKRMTSATQYSQDNQNYFNSHPHEEDDTSNQERIQKEDISTHILMKRMTDGTTETVTTDAFQLTSS